jgi:hypothetical protein
MSALEKGENIQLLASKYRIQQTKIEQWLRNALAIKQRLNYKGKTRLFSTERNHKLLPGPLRSTPEKQLLNKAYQACRKIYQNDNSQLEWAINYALDHTSSSKSYISFNSPAELTKHLFHMLWIMMSKT